MERCLMLRLQTQGCAAEVWLNDVPVGRASAQQGSLCLPVHEYLLAGNNRIQLVIEPTTPEQGAAARFKYADGTVGASARLLLPRVGSLGHESQARSLAELVWAAADGDVYQAGHKVSVDADLPVKFPRWRWLEAPPIESPGTGLADLKPVAGAYLQRLAIAMARGEVDSFVQACRLKLEEVALAYQQPVAEASARLLSRLQLLHATRALKMLIPDAGALHLRLCGNGRLLECLGPDGEPVLRTLPAADGSWAAWPVRLAIVNGQCHILR